MNTINCSTPSSRKLLNHYPFLVGGDNDDQKTSPANLPSLSQEVLSGLPPKTNPRTLSRAILPEDSARSKYPRPWYLKNPDCLQYQRDLTHRWFKEHPHYQKTYRLNHPQKVCKNRQDAKIRMRRRRDKSVFDKTNSIMSQLVENKADKCYLNARSGWVYLRLIKQTRYTKHLRLCQTPVKVTPGKVLVFGKSLYDLGSILAGKRPP